MDDRNAAKEAVAEWLDEIESYSLRRERLHDDILASPSNVVRWLETAYALGMEAAARPDPRPAGSGYEWLDERRRSAEEAREFPSNTCPPSRHVQLVAEALASGGSYPMIEEDPRHVAASLYGALASLWETRNRVAELEAAASEPDAPTAPGA